MILTISQPIYKAEEADSSKILLGYWCFLKRVVCVAGSRLDKER